MQQLTYALRWLRTIAELVLHIYCNVMQYGIISNICTNYWIYLFITKQYYVWKYFFIDLVIVSYSFISKLQKYCDDLAESPLHVMLVFSYYMWCEYVGKLSKGKVTSYERWGTWPLNYHSTDNRRQYEYPVFIALVLDKQWVWHTSLFTQHAQRSHNRYKSNNVFD